MQGQTVDSTTYENHALMLFCNVNINLGRPRLRLLARWAIKGTYNTLARSETDETDQRYSQESEFMKVSFAILNPIASEFEEMCKVLSNLEEAYPMTLPAKFGNIGNHSVVCVLSGKGQAFNAAALQYVFRNWEPRWVLLAGLAGGFPGQGVRRGDVVVASCIFAMDFGKLVEGRYILRPENDSTPDHSLLSYANLIAGSEKQEWINQIKVVRPDGQPKSASKIHFGYVASGDKVIDDPNHEFFKAVQKSKPEIHAVEMEGAGIGSSIRLEQSSRAVGFLMVRGISDEPTTDRINDFNSGTEQRKVWKQYAASAAASFAHALIDAFPAENHTEAPNSLAEPDQSQTAFSPMSRPMADNSSYRERDLRTIRKIFGEISTEIFDNFIDRGGYYEIVGEIFHFFEGVHAIMTSSSFHVYDPELRIKILEFYEAWARCFEFYAWVTDNVQCTAYRFLKSHEVIDSGGLQKARRNFIEAISRADDAYRGFIQFVREKYSDIDIDDLSTKALDNYKKFVNRYGVQ